MRYVLTIVLGTGLLLASAALAAKVCPECQQEWPDEDNYCTACGAKLPGKCANCGTLFRKADQNVCHNCGYNVVTGRMGAGPKVVYENDFSTNDLKGLKIYGSGKYSIANNVLRLGDVRGGGEEMRCGIFGGGYDLKDYTFSGRLRIVSGCTGGSTGILYAAVSKDFAVGIGIPNSFYSSDYDFKYFALKGNVLQGPYDHGAPKTCDDRDLFIYCRPSGYTFGSSEDALIYVENTLSQRWFKFELTLRGDEVFSKIGDAEPFVLSLKDLVLGYGVGSRTIIERGGMFGVAVFDDQIIEVDDLKVTQP